jgi:dTMP kinase
MFITLEGIDGSSKTTASHEIVHTLNQAGFLVRLVQEPGQTHLGRYLRAFLLANKKADSPPVPRAELFMFLAARAQTVKEVILPALEEGMVVVCDRYVDSTFAYQGRGRGLIQEAVESGWDSKAWHEMVMWSGYGLWPDLTLLFRVDTTVGLSRAMRAENSETRFEGLGNAFMDEVADAYYTMFPASMESFSTQNGALGKRDPGLGHDLYWQFPSLRPPYRIIDANKLLDEVLADVRRIIEDEVIPVLEGGAHENDRLNHDRNPADAPGNRAKPGQPTDAGEGGTGNKG